MTKTFYISDWEDWVSVCEENNVNPYEYVDFSVGVPGHRQITGGESVDYKFVGDYPNEEED